jgi:hypothetical protein
MGTLMASVSSEPSERSFPGTMGEPKKLGFTIYVSCQYARKIPSACCPKFLPPSSNNTPIIRISSAAAVSQEVTGRRQIMMMSSTAPML